MFDAITTAIEQFWDFLSDIAILPLLAAIGCHLLKLACTSRAWRNVLAAAYPDRTVRWPPILAAYVSGVGVNAILPARGGDVVRVFLAHRAIPGSSYTTIVASTVVLIFVDMTLALLVFAWALTQGVLPSLDALGALPAFDYSWVFDEGVIHPGAVIAFVAVVAGGTWLLHHFWNRLRARVAQAFAVFEPPSPVRPHGRRLAARRLGAPARDDLVLPRRVRHRADHRQRAARPGDDEPRDARPRHPGRHRHRAGAHRLRVPRTSASPGRPCSRSASG